MHVIDVSDPAQPRRVGGYRDGLAHGVAVSGHYAYLAEGPRDGRSNSAGGGLVILDVNDPSSPKRVGVFASGTFVGKVSVSGNYAYVDGMQVIDISNPSEPKSVGGNPIVSTASLAVSGGLIFAAAPDGHGLAILDLFRPFGLELIPEHTSNRLRVRMNGPRGVNVRIQRSSDLIDWMNWQSTVLGGSPRDVSDAMAGPAQGRFYRAITP